MNQENNEKRQSTGLFDAKGKEILLGDIIHDAHYVGRGKKDHYYFVEIKDGELGMTNISRGTFTTFEDFTFTSEVIIGNIIDNPELSGK